MANLSSAEHIAHLVDVMNSAAENLIKHQGHAERVRTKATRTTIALTLKSPVMPCAALVIAKSERKIFLWIDFDSGARDCELTKVTESISFDQLSIRLIDSVSLVKFKGRVTATIRLCS